MLCLRLKKEPNKDHNSNSNNNRNNHQHQQLRLPRNLRFNLFQLQQAMARVAGAGVPAKGLTGRGYERHYFWDAEIHVIAFLIYTAPRVATSLLRFRHQLLDPARERTREPGHRGAMFLWRTINGE